MASLLHNLFCLLLLHLYVLTSAQPYRNISLGSSLSNLDETPYYTSPSAEFNFGFYPQQDLFLLAIWFANVPVKRIVWTANQGKPVERAATILLRSSGVLSLITPNGTEIWKAQALNSSRVANAALLDTGNLVLTTAESTILWESFDNPIDTLLPNQKLAIGNKLSSRRTEEDFTAGRFEFILRDDGNLLLRPIARPTEGYYDEYWSSNTHDNFSHLVFNQSGYIHQTLKNGSLYTLSSEVPLSTRDYYRRATLDFDGVLRQYTYPKTFQRNQSWPTSWSLPQDICAVVSGRYAQSSGVCGYNSYCKLNQDQRPVCECPPGYSYLDPQNPFEGCQPSFAPQSCMTNILAVAEGFEMQVIPSTDFTGDDYELFKSVDEDWCGATCLNNCFCAAVRFSQGNCWLKKYPLSRGYMNPGSEGKTLIKVGKSSMEQGPSPVFGGKNENKNHLILPGSIVLSCSGFLNILFLLLAIYGSSHKKRTKKPRDTHTFGTKLQSFTFKELEDATDTFKEALGKGASSTVYKGDLKSGSGSLVAVKRLDKVVLENDKEFKAEMSAIGKSHHKNLVRLLGFCEEDAHQLLVYEFMKNGSLESFLFKSLRLDWYQRIQIALGIARGLSYLHEECSTQIIHCDVKPQNILLDDSYEARISDFGLAKLLKSNQTRTTTGIRGTRGYVAPEWFKNMPITAKVDVYSFGIMLLEVVCCRKNVEQEIGDEEVDILSDWAFECCVQRTVHLLVPNDEEAKNDSKTLEKLVMVSIWCIQENPSLRPSMRKVTQMLEGATEVSMPPNPSPFSTVD